MVNNLWSDIAIFYAPIRGQGGWEYFQLWLFSSVAQSCANLCDLMDCSTPGFPVHHQLPELVQTHVH